MSPSFRRLESITTAAHVSTSLRQQITGHIMAGKQRQGPEADGWVKAHSISKYLLLPAMLPTPKGLPSLASL